MIIEHHPSDMMLAAFAAGKLDLGQHVAIATHLASCGHCRGFVQDMEQVGGALLSEFAPSEVSAETWAKIEARLTEPPPAGSAIAASRHAGEPALLRLPSFVRHYRFGTWRWIGPSVHLRPVMLPHASATRIFLLKSGPGAKMLQHTHTGLEMTCVLSGAFSQNGAHYGPGDFDWGDADADHRPIVDSDEECVCLVAMEGQLRLEGFLGRLVQPLIRM